jgi:DNA-binding CsgD family transcriptional regulator
VDRIQFDSLLQWQIDKVIQEGALTSIQLDIFRLLLEGRYYDDGIASQLGMSRRSYYRHKKKLKSKIYSVLFHGT